MPDSKDPQPAAVDPQRLERVDFAEFPEMYHSGTPVGGSQCESASASSRFWSKRKNLESLMAEQGLSPVESIKEYRAPFWPEDETVDEFVESVRRWRHEDQ